MRRVTFIGCADRPESVLFPVRPAEGRVGGAEVSAPVVSEYSGQNGGERRLLMTRLVLGA